MGEGVTPQAIREIVNSYALKLENEGIAPHYLRRTFAKLAHKGGSPIDQIQLSLGHDSIQTTEKYLGGGAEFARRTVRPFGTADLPLKTKL